MLVPCPNYSKHKSLINVTSFRDYIKTKKGFRKFRGTTDALLRVTQDICNGFNRKESTAGLFIDIEKAYDSVWRDGLLFKLKEMGIRGRVWAWIRNFLTDRKAVINIAGERTQEFDSNIGLPQGSVISPLLFILFIADCYKEVSCKKVKFADDGTIWKTGKDWHKLLEELKSDFRHVCMWASRWRIKLSILKTEFCIFSLDKQVLEEARNYIFEIDGQKVKYNPTPKILGVTLDEKLKFEMHTEQLERKASKTMALLRKVKETEVLSTRCMLQLYKALVAPQLEYAAAVWQIGNCDCLEKIQRKGLAMCLGVPMTASAAAVEVEAGVKPLELRREELAIRQAGRIMMKGDEECIKVSWDSFKDQEGTEQKISPFGKMNIQVADMLSNTGVTLNGLEKEFNYLESLQPSKQRPEYWNGLGSSKSRTGEQEKLSREIIGGLIDQCDAGTAVAFTDGSCLGNPGPCGAGACVFPPGAVEPVMLKQPVTNRGSILLGEMVAIKMAPQYIVRCKARGEGISKVHIFSDSQSAVGQLTLGWEANSHKTTAQEVIREKKKLEEKEVTVEVSWSPGHADIKGNDYADKLAKEAAQEAKDSEQLSAVISLGDVKSAAKESGKKKWQDMWDKSDTGRDLYRFRQKVDHKVKHTHESAFGERIISQLRTGYVRLNEYLHKCNLKDTDQCQCGSKESISHFLLDCPNYEPEREIMRKRLFETCGVAHLDLNLLLDAKKDDEFTDWRSYILTELENFVVGTGRFTTHAN